MRASVVQERQRGRVSHLAIERLTSLDPFQNPSRKQVLFRVSGVTAEDAGLHSVDCNLTARMLLTVSASLCDISVAQDNGAGATISGGRISALVGSRCGVVRGEDRL